MAPSDAATGWPTASCSAYHLHVPWAIPETLIADTLIVSYPAKRYRSAWIGIVVHSAQSVVLAIIVLTLVV
jgi:uncharacterized protein